MGLELFFPHVIKEGGSRTGHKARDMAAYRYAELNRTNLPRTQTCYSRHPHCGTNRSAYVQNGRQCDLHPHHPREGGVMPVPIRVYRV